MADSLNEPHPTPRRHVIHTQRARAERRRDTGDGIPERQSLAPSGHDTQAHLGVTLQHTKAKAVTQRIDRGLTSEIHPTALQKIVWIRALLTVNRFRVVRAIDIAVACFPERPFKASLTAAQRAMRGLAKAKLVRRYRTDRLQHVYGLTVGGARWLHDQGIDATASVRRVADMSNPEHTLWMNFITLCCEARGVPAETESEALRELNAGRDKSADIKQGFVTVETGGRQRILRPDVLAYEQDGVTWFEIDRSKRGSDREAALCALAGRIGARLSNNQPLRRIVVLARTDRILLRALALLRGRVRDSDGLQLTSEIQRRFLEFEEGIFEVWAMVYVPDRQQYIDHCVGHVIVQLLPTWLPKVRLDSSNRQPLSGWFEEDYLPYRRPSARSPWTSPISPLLPFSSDASGSW
ncbi:replication-relaxation family protein [Paraburkholderia sp.]|uniref:replication-relaxation family protein n=1 Tax=Paraburkholderia sp. TaxID=1926495 RepID=UPI0025E76423|nr:replication-relaxation family protein [Paraburkholderia sp.]